MAIKTERFGPMPPIPPRTRTERAEDWLGEHDRIGRGVLLLTVILVPICGAYWGILDAWQAWKDDWYAFVNYK